MLTPQSVTPPYQICVSIFGRGDRICEGFCTEILTRTRSLSTGWGQFMCGKFIGNISSNLLPQVSIVLGSVLMNLSGGALGEKIRKHTPLECKFLLLPPRQTFSFDHAQKHT